MGIGILSECQTKEKAPLLPLLRRAKLHQLTGNLPATVAELPYTAAEFSSLSPKRQRKQIAGALAKLSRAGLTQIVCTETLRPYVSEQAEPVTGPELPPELIQAAALYAIDRAGSGLSARLLIYDRELSAVNLAFLERLCLMAKTITIYTGRTDRAEELAEALLEEFGLYINVFDDCEHTKQMADILIDADRHLVRVGRDFVVSGAELDFDLGGYPVSSGDLAACLGPKVRSYQVKNFLSGKKRLTI